MRLRQTGILIAIVYLTIFGGVQIWRAMFYGHALGNLRAQPDRRRFLLVGVAQCPGQPGRLSPDRLSRRPLRQINSFDMAVFDNRAKLRGFHPVQRVGSHPLAILRHRLTSVRNLGDHRQ